MVAFTEREQVATHARLHEEQRECRQGHSGWNKKGPREERAAGGECRYQPVETHVSPKGLALRSVGGALRRSQRHCVVEDDVLSSVEHTLVEAVGWRLLS